MNRDKVPRDSDESIHRDSDGYFNSKKKPKGSLASKVLKYCSRIFLGTFIALGSICALAIFWLPIVCAIFGEQGYKVLLTVLCLVFGSGFVLAAISGTGTLLTYVYITAVTGDGEIDGFA